MSFLVRSLSRERARTGDLREGRAEVLRELVVGGGVNWLAVSQLLALVQSKGAIPDVVRKILKDLLSSEELPTALAALAIVDMLALNCPDGRVRAQLAGPKWARRLGARAAEPPPRGCARGLPAALAQLLANWATAFAGAELGAAAGAECTRLRARGYAPPPPSDEAYAAAAAVAAQAQAQAQRASDGGEARTFLHATDYARDYLPPRPLARASGEGVAGWDDEPNPQPPSSPPAVAGGAQQQQQQRAGPPPAARDVVLATATKAASPAFEAKRRLGALARASAEPVLRSLGGRSKSAPAPAPEAAPEPPPPAAAAPQADSTPAVPVASEASDAAEAAGLLAAAVAETIACVKRDKTRLAAADDACRAAVVRFNAGHRDASDMVMSRAEAGFTAALACSEWADRVQALCTKGLPDDLASKLLEANDALAGQLRRWHALLANPVVQAALAGPASPRSSGPGAAAGDAPGWRSPPRSMHLLDLPGAWSAPHKQHNPRERRRATAPNTPCLAAAPPPDADAAELERLAASTGLPASAATSASASARKAPSSSASFNFVRHTRSVSSPEGNSSAADAGGSPDRARRAARRTLAATPVKANSADLAWQLASGSSRWQQPRGGRTAEGAAGRLQSGGRGVTSAPTSVQDLGALVAQVPGPPGSIRTSSAQPSGAALSEGTTPASSQRSAASARHRTPFSDYWHSAQPSPGLSSRASVDTQGLSRRVTWDLQPNGTYSAMGSAPEGGASREQSATPESRTPSGGASAEQVAYLKKQVDSLMEQLHDAMQAKAQSQQEVLQSHRARMAAELEVIQLQGALEAERAAASQETALLRQALQQMESQLAEYAVAECARHVSRGAGTASSEAVASPMQLGQVMQENKELRAELSRCQELLKGHEADAATSKAPPAHPATPTAQGSTAPFPMDLAERTPSRVLFTPGSAARPAADMAGTLRAPQGAQPLAAAPPLLSDEPDAAAEESDAGYTSGEEARRMTEAVLAYETTPQVQPPRTTILDAQSSPAADALIASHPDLLTLSPDNPFL
eukprot:jgi/Tetstr1/441944/TSEL_030149.t1